MLTPLSSVEEAGLAVGNSSIKSASRMNGVIIIFLDKTGVSENNDLLV